jgi:hypothetical protein
VNAKLIPYKVGPCNFSIRQIFRGRKYFNNTILTKTEATWLPSLRTVNNLIPWLPFSIKQSKPTAEQGSLNIFESQ